MGGTGFPTLMFLDAEGRKLMKYSGPRSVDGFASSFEEIKSFQELQKKADAGDEKAAVEVFIAQLKLGWLELAAAREKLGKLPKVSSKQQKEIDQLLVDLEVREVAQAAGDDRDELIKAGARFHAMWKDKRVPAAESELYSFWMVMAEYAEAERDKKLFKKIVSEFEDSVNMASSRNRKTLKSLESRLENFPK